MGKKGSQTRQPSQYQDSNKDYRIFSAFLDLALKLPLCRSSQPLDRTLA
jgi:hypothetical protein